MQGKEIYSQEGSRRAYLCAQRVWERSPAISPEKVKEVRTSIQEKRGYYTSAELLKEHPME